MAIFLSSLKKLGQLDPIQITILNVGSRRADEEDDFGAGAWGAFAPNLRIYGFDADADACEIINSDLEARQINWVEKHVPIALSDSVGEATLYVTKMPDCSSLYPPNEAFLKRFASLPEFVDLDFEVELETTTLDTFLEEEGVGEVDFAKIDVQGADLRVLKGSQQILQNSLLVIQIEVEFSPLYQGQPLFAEVDQFLRHHGFSLFDIHKSHRIRACSPIFSNFHPGQLLWGEAFYMRDLLQEDLNPEFKTPEKLFKLACIADALDFPDYAMELLVHLTLNYGEDPRYNFANTIVEGLALFPGLVQEGLEKIDVVKQIQPYLDRPLSEIIAG